MVEITLKKGKMQRRSKKKMAKASWRQFAGSTNQRQANIQGANFKLDWRIMK